MSVLLQISDPHFGTERPRVVEALVSLAQRERPDLVVLSGDITQRARAEQFAAARAFADRLGAPFVAIPGNHDIPLLDLPAPRLRAYPRESVIAEKLHAMVVLGTRNSRMKDYFDLDALAREGAVEAARLAEAIAATFARRETVIPDGMPPGLAEEFAEDDSKQAQWKAFLTRSRLLGRSLPETIAEVRAFLREPLKLARERMEDRR